jgi:coronafacic acid polyketide synthase Cfa7
VTTTPATTTSATIAAALRRTLLVNEQLRRANRQLTATAREPVAVVAMGCRLPGGIRSPEQLWRLVAAGQEAIAAFPDDRGWQLPPPAAGPADRWRGGFLSNVARFDAGFFGISDREALAMDPQQRLLLETAWEVLERAGVVPGTLRGSPTGVFIGTAHQDYLPGLDQQVPAVQGYRLQGSLTSIASGRISYTLGLTGPAVTVDTACSSSLSAVHLAVRSLRAGECSLALAGGVTVMATPEVFTEFVRHGGLAADGRVKAFGDGADGTVFSEGVALLLLERLSDALRNDHPVLALVRGSALNQDGASNGLTAPNGPAQEQVIRSALADAGLTPAEVDAVEAHGTGTALGDPIEANALIQVYGPDRPRGRPLWLGALKSNLGHTQAASGAAGMIKMVMALQRAELPATLHATVPSAKVDWAGAGVELLTTARSWPGHGRPRRAGVSSFGISGTNAHVILEQAPESAQARVGATGAVPEPGGEQPQPPALPVPGLCWPVSAASAQALQAQATQLHAFVTAAPGTDLGAAGYSLATTRAHLPHRAVVTAGDRAGLLDALQALAADQSSAGVIRGTTGAAPGTTAFLFSGQGCQWPGMGRSLYQQSPVFAAALDEVCAALDPHLEPPLRDVMFAAAGTGAAALLDRTDYTQAALFALEVALVRTLEDVGIRPGMVAGHSAGEIAAAHVAGVLTLPDSATLVAARGRLMQSLPGTGSMVTVQAGEQEVLASIAGLAPLVDVAAVNAPSSVVVSGDRDAVAQLGQHWRERGRRVQPLHVGHAFHSPHVDPVLGPLRAVAADLDLRPPALPMVSTLTGTALTGEQACSPDYWARQARGAVRFADALTWMREHGASTFLEIGPDAVLTALGRGGQPRPATGPGARDPGSPGQVSWIPSLRRGRDELRTLTAALARLHVLGAGPDWARLLPASERVGLPTYPFRGRRYWLRTPPRPLAAGGGAGPAAHPFLTSRVEVAGGQEWIFTGSMSSSSHPWLAEHVVAGTATVAGAVTAELVLHAGAQVGGGHLEDLTLLAPLPVPADGTVDLQVRLGAPSHGGQRAADVYFRLPAAPGWTRHATGVLAPPDTGPTTDAPVWPELQCWPPPGADPVDVPGLYAHLAEEGVGFGPAFQRVTAAWRRDGEVFLEAALPTDGTNGATGAHGADGAAGFTLHPTLLDAGLQASLIASRAGTQASPRTSPAGEPSVRMLFSLSGLRLYAGGVGAVRAQLSPAGPVGDLAGQDGHSLRLADAAGRPVAQVRTVRLRTVPPPAGRPSPASRQPYQLDWQEFPYSASPAPALAGWILPGHRADDADSTHSVQDSDGAARYLRRADPAAAVFPGPGPALDALTAAEEPAASGQREAGGQREAEGPAAVALLAGSASPGEPVEQAAHRTTRDLLATVQQWLADERSRPHPLVVITRGAVATNDHQETLQLAQTPAWGLLRTAQVEHPGRFLLLDVDEHEQSWATVPAVVAAALAGGEPQLALRRGRARVPRLTRPDISTALTPPPGERAWRLSISGKVARSLDGLVLAPCPDAAAALTAGQVRVAVRAAGISFRDVLVTLGMYPGEGLLGMDLSGVVLETGPGVPDLRPGDRVMGLALGGVMGPLAVIDRSSLTRIPPGWTFAQAATIPSTFLTAWQSLADTAAVQPGEQVLVHAAAGGVGMAAVQIARHLGAEVWATAHPTKHAALQALGLDPSRLASSRDPGFEQHFRQATGGRGVDVVLHSLSGRLTDASLRLLAPGGRLIDLGRTDRRDPSQAAQAAGARPDTRYYSYELPSDPNRIAVTLAQLEPLFLAGTLTPLPLIALDIRDARQAFQLIRNASHIGKIVLTVPASPDPAGTVLITGGTGTLGALAARHLVAEHGARHLLLASRRGAEAPGAARLRDDLASAGAEVSLAACDTSDPAALTALLAAIPADHPLTAVIHTAGAVDPAAVVDLTPGQISGMLHPKADTAWHLHRLTQHLDLAAFVIYSSAVGILGLAGQGNYAAANTFVDALAHHRHRLGLPATAVSWGMWAQRSGLAERLGSTGIHQVLDAGLAPIPAAEGLAHLDAALPVGLAGHLPLQVAARLDLGFLRSRGHSRLLSDLAASVPSWPAGGQSPGHLFAHLPPPERDRHLLDLVTGHAGTVLARPDPASITSDAEFRALGFDSLTAVELSGRLSAATGQHLPATLVFDHPTPAALVRYLGHLLSGGAPPGDSQPDGAAAAAVRTSSGAGRLEALLRRAIAGGRTSEGVSDLAAAGRLRPRFTAPESPAHAPSATWLSRHGDRPLLICVDSFIGAAGNLTYQRLAAALGCRYDVAAVPLPGYRPGEALPESADATAGAVASAVLDCAAGRPFTLLGFSTGGLAAHAAARRLETLGAGPAAVVLIDSLPPGAITRAATADILREWSQAKGEFWSRDDTSLAAMGWYMEMFAARWSPAALAAPVLLLLAGTQVPADPDGAWALDWPGLAACVSTPGTHFSLLSGHASQTAATLTTLLRERITDASSGPVAPPR